MLDRIKKILIVASTIGTMYLSLPAFALDSTVSYININNLAYQDVEIVITDKDEILVPFKQLADIFEIKYEANRVDKQISFTTIDGKVGMITQKGVFVEDYPISKGAVVFIQQGIMDGVINEAYISASAAAQIMGIKLSENFEDLTLEAEVNRDIPILENLNSQLQAENKGPRAYKNIVTPKKPKKITLNNIGVKANVLNDAVKTKSPNYTNSYDNFAGGSSLSTNGFAFGGKYRVEVSESHLRNDLFMFNGLTATYRNSIKDKKGKERVFYELGKVEGIRDNDITMGGNIFGLQVWNYDTQRIQPGKISGYVKPTSMVRLTVNDLEPVILSTYAGYYTLKDVQLPNPVLSIKLEEINEDGTIEPIREEKYSIYGNKVPFEKEHRGTVYAGVWGYNNRLFREGRSIYRGNNKKVTGGGEYQYGLKDNITVKAKISGDKIYEKNSAGVVWQAPTNDTLLVTGTQKNVNYIEGATNIESIEWINPNNKNVKARAVGGVSVSNDVREEKTRLGFLGKLEGQYEADINKYSYGIFKPKKSFTRLEAFYSSPDWYVAGADGTSLNDRIGGRIFEKISFNDTNVGGSYARYYSNVNHRYHGGSIKFDEASINATSKIQKVADLRFNSYYKRGENNEGRNKNYNYDANASRNFGLWLKLQAGRRENYYNTQYWTPAEAQNSFKSKYADNYAQMDINIPKNLGKFMFGHSIIRYQSGNYDNGYNMFRFGYTFPTWKRLTLGWGWGIRYRGQGGNDFNVNLGYRSKSGQSITFGYQYTENGGYFVDNMYLPSTNRHSINLVFNDAFQVFHNGLKSVGTEDMNRGLFEAIAFVDNNKNGKYDSGVDVPISDIPIKASWMGENNATNRSGRFYSTSIEEGVYTVAIDMDTLPITVAPQTNDIISRHIKIEGGQTTRLEIPLSSTVGSVSGTLHIADDFNRDLKISDFIVVILDENGEEVNYSTVGESGDYYISGLAPGKYTIQLDEKFINTYGLEELPNSRIQIIIPKDYKNPTDLMDKDLEYRAMAL